MDHEPKQTVQRLRFAGKERDGPLEHPHGKTPVQRQRAQRLRASQAKPGALRREQDAPPEMSRLTPDPLHAVTGRLQKGFAFNERGRKIPQTYNMLR